MAQTCNSLKECSSQILKESACYSYCVLKSCCALCIDRDGGDFMEDGYEEHMPASIKKRIDTKKVSYRQVTALFRGERRCLMPSGMQVDMSSAYSRGTITCTWS